MSAEDGSLCSACCPWREMDDGQVVWAEDKLQNRRREARKVAARLTWAGLPALWRQKVVWRQLWRLIGYLESSIQGV